MFLAIFLTATKIGAFRHENLAFHYATLKNFIEHEALLLSHCVSKADLLLLSQQQLCNNFFSSIVYSVIRVWQLSTLPRKALCLGFARKQLP